MKVDMLEEVNDCLNRIKQYESGKSGRWPLLPFDEIAENLRKHLPKKRTLYPFLNCN